MNWKAEGKRWRMKYKGAIFDMDGVLFDTERLYQETWQELAEERDIKLENSFLRAISGTNGIHMKRVIEQYYRVTDGTAVMEECMNRMKRKLDINVPLKAGVYKILEYFQENGVRLAVASSSSAQQIESNLVRGGIRKYFAEIVSGEEVEHGKPSPDIFILAAEKIGCRPEECLVFEDSENGVTAGYRAGCFTIMIPDLIEPRDEIRAICSAIYPDFFKLCEEIEKY